MTNPGQKNRVSPLIFMPLLVTLFFAALFAVALLGDRDPAVIKSVLIGQKAPLLDGQTLLPDARPIDPEKPTLVNFFASWCVPCRAEHSSLEALAKSGSVNLVGIVFADKPVEALMFLEELGNPYGRVLKDQDSRLAFAFGVAAVPETFIIDRDGILRFRVQGPLVGDAFAPGLTSEIEKWR